MAQQQNPHKPFSTPVGNRPVQDQPVSDGFQEDESVDDTSLPPGGTATNMVTPQSNPTMESDNEWRRGLASPVLPAPLPIPYASTGKLVPQGHPAGIVLDQARYRVLPDTQPGQDVPPGDMPMTGEYQP